MSKTGQEISDLQMCFFADNWHINALCIGATPRIVELRQAIIKDHLFWAEMVWTLQTVYRAAPSEGPS